VSSIYAYTIEPSLQLGTEALAAVRQLVEACEAAEPAPVRIPWGMLQQRPGLTPLDFCCYLDGTLAGYLFMDQYDPKERETVILVHPAYRRRGIAHALLKAAYEQCQRAGVEQIILICERRAVAGKAFVEHFQARFAWAEHEMVLGEFQPRDGYASKITFRPAEPGDFDAMVAIQADSFDEPADQVRERLLRHLQEQTDRIYVATVASGQDANTALVGMLRLTAEGQETGIYGLGVAPAYQGHGYGRQLVEEAIRAARATNPEEPIMLDVDESNTRAFNLYLSCGFKVRATYDYCALRVNENLEEPEHL
jgi:ribosomal protein S18 acetylase RimI-like enzyme